MNIPAVAPIGRLAPSPSGRMHLGNVFAALMAWLAARSQGGKVVLRLEDLDPRSQSQEAARVMLEDLEWLGLTWDRGPLYQREDGANYSQALEELAQRNLVYPCFCTRAELHVASAPHTSDGTYIYPGSCRELSAEEVELKAKVRQPGLRLKVPAASSANARIGFDDAVYGPQEQSLATECGDFLLSRSDGVISYQLAVVLDDAQEGVTQVVRGRDLLGSTARQIYLQRLLGLPQPSYAHIPLLVAPDGRRLAKRDGDLNLGTLRKRYAAPDPILGKLASCVGMAEAGEACSATDLIGRFSFATLKKHASNIVVDTNFLP